MTHFIQDVPVLLKVLATLLLILAVNNLFRRLLPAVFLGTVLLGLWCGFTPAAIFSIACASVFSADNLLLLLVLIQVIWLSGQMSASGLTTGLISFLGSRFRKRAVMAMLPAVIGMLPMPGGALFSAPMVDECDSRRSLSPMLKTRINYWFRHVWEYWWPLYPGVMLAIDLTGLEIWQFMLLQIPMTLASVGIGYLFLLRKVPPLPADGAAKGGNGRMATLMAPILVTIGVYGLVKISYAAFASALPGLPHLQKYVPMSIGLFCAAALLQKMSPLKAASWKKIVLSRSAPGMVVLVAAIRVYGAFIEARLPGGQFLADAVRLELVSWGIPLVAVVMLLPFVAGLSTGISVGFVGASFPVVMRVIGQDPPTAVLLSTTILAFGSGYVGMLLSPVHVCLLVTLEHFKVNLAPGLLRLLLPCAALLFAAVCFHLLIAAFWPR